MSTEVRSWVVARHRLQGDIWGVLLIWAVFAVFVFGLVLVVAAFRPIEVSGWETGSQLPRWFAGAVGVYATAVYLPLYVAHGYTRREVARQLPVATGGTILLLSVLMTAGYGIERAVYAAAGWPQTLRQTHLFSSPDQYHLVFAEFVLLFTVWTIAGALVGAGFYRNPLLGFATIPVGLLMLGSAEAVLNPGFFEVVTAFTGFLGIETGVSVGASVGVALVAAAVGLPATWAVIRDMPLRPQRA